MRRRKNPRDEYADYYEDEVRLEKRKRKRASTDKDQKFQVPAFIVHLTGLGLVGAVLLGLVWATAGKEVLEKTLQALAAPLGIIWVGLFLTTYFCLLHRQAASALVSFVCWVLLTLSGNAIVSSWLVDSLQQPYKELEVAKGPPFDYLVVLGGGQMTAPNGSAQLADAGDRGILALRLYRQEKATRIICTGTSGLPLAEGELTQADALQQILVELGVPEEKIITIGGRNTLQEMQALDEWISANQATDKRIGILTSAWHLKRAMRLAKSVGIKAEPVPADFSNSRLTQTPYMLIPGSAYLHQTTFCLREYMAGMVGR